MVPSIPAGPEIPGPEDTKQQSLKLERDLRVENAVFKMAISVTLLFVLGKLMRFLVELALGGASQLAKVLA